MNQVAYAQVGSRSAADGQSQNHFDLNCAFAQVNNAGADLGEEVEERVRTHGAHRRHAQTEDKNREQQNAAPDSRHSDEGPDSKTYQDLDQQIHVADTRLTDLNRLRSRSDEAFPLQVQDDFLRCLFGG